jgi:type IV pilus assembly protein PilO
MMDLSEINWDFNAAGSWPLQIKAAAILIACCLVAGGGFYAFTIDQLAELDVLQAKENELITTFTEKQRKAVNLDDYRTQFDDIKKSLKDMMMQMPTEAEVAKLLSDISETAINSGLEPKLFQPELKEKKDFYVELPYSIEMVGKYEELGLFVGGLASLPRIVTVHNIEITPIASKTTDNKAETDLMLMKAIVKTYNEAGEGDNDDKGKGKGKGKNSKEKNK